MPPGRRFLVLTVLSFIALGMPMQAMGVAWPSVADELGRPIGNLGLLVFAFGAGYAISTFSSGHLSWRVGPIWLLGGASGTSALSLIVIALFDVWGALVAVTFLLGLAGGLLDSGVNAHVAVNYGTRPMGVLHAGWGIGSVLGPGLVTVLLAADVSWRVAFAIFAAAQAALAIGFLRSAGKAGSAKLRREEASPSRPPATGAILALSAMTFFLYAALATATGGWAFSVLSEGRGINEAMAGIAVSGYWAGLTGSRLALGLVGGRLELDRLLTVCTVTTVASLGLFWWAPTPALGICGLVFSGFAHGALFPVQIVLTARRFGEGYTPWAVGYEIAAGNVGVATIGVVFDVLVNHIGLEVVAPALLVIAIGLHLSTNALERLSAAAAQEVPVQAG